MLRDSDAACSGYLSSEAPECFVCAESGGELLSNICACRGRHVHLACLRKMRQQTPAHSDRCAVCLSPYDSASDPMAPPTQLASKAVDSAAKLLDHLWPYLLQSLFLVYVLVQLRKEEPDTAVVLQQTDGSRIFFSGDSVAVGPPGSWALIATR